MLTVDSVTVNLADGHFLKVGLGFQLAIGQVAETAKTDNMGAAALNSCSPNCARKPPAISGPKHSNRCASNSASRSAASEGKEPNPGLKYEGKILTVYFTDFVSQ